MGSETGLVGIILALGTLLGACGSSGSAGESPPPPGPMCPTQPGCNTLTDNSAPVNPTCTTGTMPTGTGGTIADGTYVLTSQTVYNAGSVCPDPISETLVVTGGCVQIAGYVYSTGGGESVHVTAPLTVKDNLATLFPQCASPSPPLKPDFSERSYTATSTTVTFYTHPSSGGPDHADVITKQ
jgi:major membrane immunogen (membrane-anchored lipoprotein)